MDFDNENCNISYGSDKLSCTSHHDHSVEAFDRFIPFRPNLDVNRAHEALLTPKHMVTESFPEKDRGKRRYSDLLSHVLDGSHGIDHRILPCSVEHTSERKDHHSSCSGSLCRLSSPLMDTSDDVFASPTGGCPKRRVCTSPDCVMDMPKLRDDFYTNVLDWGQRNRIAVALHQITYVWDADSRLCKKIDFGISEPESFYMSALSWDPHGNLLAIADSTGQILISDVERAKVIRTYKLTENVPIGVIRWTKQGLFSGNREGNIYVHDTRTTGERPRSTLSSHKREVCGLQVAENGNYMCSGSDDGVIHIWDMKNNNIYRSIKAHTACAKALAWCPWRPSVLASGGGCSDGYIRLWHIHTGEKLGEIYTNSQVCSLVWSKEYCELVSSHGTPRTENNDIVLWKMRHLNFEFVARLRHHQGRPLHLAISPDSTTIASAGSDEALCLWRCFPTQKQTSVASRAASPLTLDRRIR